MYFFIYLGLSGLFIFYFAFIIFHFFDKRIWSFSLVSLHISSGFARFLRKYLWRLKLFDDGNTGSRQQFDPKLFKNTI